jgi:hypothetical protein
MDDLTRRRLADSYLDHVLIALEARDRGAPFRDFLDNWYAYEVGKGHLTKGGRPIWFNNPCAQTHQEALAAMHFVSRDARAILSQAREEATTFRSLRNERHPSVRLMVDHAVPLRILVRHLFEEEALRSREAIRGYLCDWYRMGVITSSEDARLNAAGLRSAMPQPWDGSVFARYVAASIEA